MGVITRYQASSLAHLSQVPSEREKTEKCDKIFAGLVKFVKNQQQQLDTPVQERKILQDRIEMLHKRWVSDNRLYQDLISQMKEDLVGKEMQRLLEASKSDLVVGLKQR